jgi:hypothetical protein
MVDPWSTVPVLAQTLALADENDRALLSRLPPTQRAKLLMALRGLVLVGMALVALVAIGARWYRRSNKTRSSAHDAEALDSWAQTPLNSGRGYEDTGNDRKQHDDE